MNKNTSMLVFIGFLAALIVATLYYAPSWGLMDDFQNHLIVEEYRANPQPLSLLGEDGWGAGFYRPVYYIWVNIAYALFKNHPTAFYIATIITNMASLLLWGLVFYELFNVKKEHFFKTVFLYPLSFFLFTPFWNVFMYLSLQEKFVIFLSPICLLLFKKAYDTKNKNFLFASIGVAVFSIFAKPTSLYLLTICFIYSVLDLLIFKYRPQMSKICLSINGALILLYAYFTFYWQLGHKYTSGYKSNLSPVALVEKFFNAPMIVKLLFILAIGMSITLGLRCLKEKKASASLTLLIPLGLVMYLILLLPWGYMSYLLSAIAPLILGTLFPVYVWTTNRGRLLNTLTHAGFMIFLILILGGIIIPYISRMADIKKVEQFMQTEGKGQYFTPPPNWEAAKALSYFTGQQVDYLHESTIDAGQLKSQGPNYLVVNNLCTPVSLKRVRASEEIYSNTTWKVVRLIEQREAKSTYAPVFKKNIIQKIKTKLKNF